MRLSTSLTTSRRGLLILAPGFNLERRVHPATRVFEVSFSDPEQPVFSHLNIRGIDLEIAAIEKVFYAYVDHDDTGLSVVCQKIWPLLSSSCSSILPSALMYDCSVTALAPE